MKQKLSIGTYVTVWSLVIGLVTVGYLTLVNWLIDLVWQKTPLGLPWAGKIFIICLTGGLTIGLLNKFLGDYPLTIAEVLTQSRRDGHINYHVWWKSFILGLTVLAAGGSVGPEASATVLVASLMNWLGDRWRLAHFTHANIWTSRLSSEKMVNLPAWHTMFASKKRQKGIVFLLTLVAIVGLAIMLKIFPEEGVFGIHLRSIAWQWSTLWAVVPAILVGLFFGWLFVKSGALFSKLIQPNWSPIIKAVLFGLLLALAGLLSKDALFSGEFRIVPFIKEALSLSPAYLLLVAFIKLITTNLGFFMGWRGGTIFPAIFSSLAIGSALAMIMPGTMQVTAAIVLAVSVTVILRRPLLTAILLILLVSIYLAPLILAACYFTAWLLKKFPVLKP
jgi:H+/Cl- antiporter ClcA